MNKDQATKRPWSISYKIGDAIICIGEPETNGTDYYGGKLICESVEPSNAKLIVKAVNCHDELVNAINNIEKLSIGFDTSLFNVKQRNAIALIYQNCMNIKQSLQKASQ